MNFLASLNVFTAWLANPPAIVSIVVTAGFELLLRLMPTVQPTGIFHIAGNLIHAVADLFDALASFSDKILPQSINPPLLIVTPTHSLGATL